MNEREAFYLLRTADHCQQLSMPCSHDRTWCAQQNDAEEHLDTSTSSAMLQTTFPVCVLSATLVAPYVRGFGSLVEIPLFRGL